MRQQATSLEPSDAWEEDLIRPGAPLDWEALRADGRVHLFFYLRDAVVALALTDAEPPRA